MLIVENQVSGVGIRECAVSLRTEIIVGHGCVHIVSVFVTHMLLKSYTKFKQYLLYVNYGFK